MKKITVTLTDRPPVAFVAHDWPVPARSSHEDYHGGLFQEFPEVKVRLGAAICGAPSYFVVSVGSAPLEVIKRYVVTQGERG